MKNFTITIKGAILMSIALSPLSVHSLNYDVLDDKKKELTESIDFQETPERSLVGIVLNRNDDISCGLIIGENQKPHSLLNELTESNSSPLAFKEDLRKAFAQHNIPLCSSEDLRIIEQADQFIETDQIFEDHSVQIASLGRALFSTPLRAAITSVVGTCLVSGSSASLTYLYSVSTFEGSLNDEDKDNLNIMALVSASLSITGSTVTSVAGGTITGVKLGQVTQGNTFKKIMAGTGGGLGTGVVSLIGGTACFLLGTPAMILLGSIISGE